MAKSHHKRKPTDKRRQSKQHDYSRLFDHTQKGKVFVPPLANLPSLSLTSWVNDRLPEMLWPALLISELGRDPGLDILRDLVETVADLLQTASVDPVDADLTLSGISRMPEAVRAEVIATMCKTREVRQALSPLLLFSDLPALFQWRSRIGIDPEHNDWNRVKRSVAIIFDHQSQEATDCRWVRVVFLLLMKRLHLPNEELVREIIGYLKYGDQQRVRPTIRSTEGVLAGLNEDRQRVWTSAFWDQCLRDSPCDRTLQHEESVDRVEVGTNQAQLQSITDALQLHFQATMVTSVADAKHEAVFGFAAYSLALLQEALAFDIKTAIVGRMVLRALLECLISLSYLVHQDKEDLWLAYRGYGAGQAKLAFLKLDDWSDVPGYVDVDLLKSLANEDRWMEFVSINVGHWGESNLRKLSEDSLTKDMYDRFYPWTSAFVHGNWAAIRNSCFALCLNPLHRFHRQLSEGGNRLGDVVPDACYLVDGILNILDKSYPTFLARVTLPARLN
ncbi:MAG: DUF5677 domain-containing protein [Dehalococcoidia bacterium]